ncbi:hypothetical protein RB195_010118 [Necator americanus]|uniref:Reverse transcriptase domain-containing protein n=2 Tax=Necator americanus TaxID=51031 RepID=A0ABR1CWH2_NECAM
MLPKLCDILLRFKIGNVAITSDVEKAFLQVRIHPQDRDATRFIWLKDPSLPVVPDNMVIYRSTRVTFGLICSPFLLAGTIKHHLENYATNKNVAREIKRNTPFYLPPLIGNQNFLPTSHTVAVLLEMQQPSTSVQGTGKHLSVSLSGDDRKNRATDKTKSDDKGAQPLEPPAPSPPKPTQTVSPIRLRHKRRPSKTIPMIPFGTIIQKWFQIFISFAKKSLSRESNLRGQLSYCQHISRSMHLILFCPVPRCPCT